jgi:hypothetical protein
MGSAVLSLVRALAVQGRSQRGVAAELATRGLLSRSGRPFGKTQIARMLNASRMTDQR